MFTEEHIDFPWCYAWDVLDWHNCKWKCINSGRSGKSNWYQSLQILFISLKLLWRWVSQQCRLGRSAVSPVVGLFKALQVLTSAFNWELHIDKYSTIFQGNLIVLVQWTPLSTSFHILRHVTLVFGYFYKIVPAVGQWGNLINFFFFLVSIKFLIAHLNVATVRVTHVYFSHKDWNLSFFAERLHYLGPSNR